MPQKKLKRGAEFYRTAMPALTPVRTYSSPSASVLGQLQISRCACFVHMITTDADRIEFWHMLRTIAKKDIRYYLYRRSRRVDIRYSEPGILLVYHFVLYR